MTTSWYVEFPNDDVGPFRSAEDAMRYRMHEGNLDETQVFTTEWNGLPWIDLAAFCPECVA